MNAFQQIVLYCVDALLLLTLVGLFVRRRYRVCHTFVPYLAVALVADILVLLWPDRFFYRWFWLFKEIAINALRFAVAIELAFRTFRAFPGARSTARAILLALLALTLVAVVAATGNLTELMTGKDPDTLIVKVQPLILNGTIWLLTAIAALVLWYRLPVDPFHKAILLGVVPYLLVFTTGLNALEAYGWANLERVSYAQSVCFMALAGYWAYAAWHPSRVPVQPPEPAPAAIERPT